MKVYKQHISIIDILIDSDDNMYYLTFDSSTEINTKIACLNNSTFSKGKVKP